MTVPQRAPGIILAGRYRWHIAAIVVAGIAAAGIIRSVQGSGLSLELANGHYASDCCGTIDLRDGQMTANGARWVGYTIGEDNQGPYLLPGRFVGTQDEGIVLDGSRPTVKLRLDRLPNPTRIDVPGIWGRDRFVRSKQRTR